MTILKYARMYIQDKKRTCNNKTLLINLKYIHIFILITIIIIPKAYIKINRKYL